MFRSILEGLKEVSVLAKAFLSVLIFLICIGSVTDTADASDYTVLDNINYVEPSGDPWTMVGSPWATDFLMANPFGGAPPEE